jgi:hypothetical protein
MQLAWPELPISLLSPLRIAVCPQALEDSFLSFTQEGESGETFILLFIRTNGHYDNSHSFFFALGFACNNSEAKHHKPAIPAADFPFRGPFAVHSFYSNRL